jgi:hypothetical protein
MPVEETKEQQQLYGTFRSCIYIFLIIELVMNLPIGTDNRMTAFLLQLLGRFKVFNSVAILQSYRADLYRSYLYWYAGKERAEV